MVTLGMMLYLFAVYLFIKNDRTYTIRERVRKAISEYNIYQIYRGDYASNKISYDCMENYFKTVFRLYDFSNKNIVPRDVYEKIKNYL